MKNKGSIDTYTTIYGPDIVVASKSVTLEQLKKLFAFSRDKELDDTLLSGCAVTAPCIRKTDNHIVSLVKFNAYDFAKTQAEKNLELINFASHEATHVALDIYEYIGSEVPTDNELQEPFAYFIGYITRCIYKTFCKK